MDEPRITQREIFELWLAATDGQASDEAVERLERLIIEQPAVRHQLIDLAQQQAWLISFGLDRDSTSQDVDLGDAEAVVLRIRSLVEGTSSESAEGSQVAPIVPPLDVPSVSDLPHGPTNVSSWGLWGFGTLAFVLLLALTAVVWNLAMRGERNVANKTHVMDVGAIRLDSGTTHMQLPHIGDMVVDGPADLELVSPKRMVLNRGKVRVRVNEAGKGFVVQTRDGEMTDLGTEFGVDVAEGCDTKLVVFDGAVDLRVADTGGTATRLIGGEAITFNREGRLSRLVSIITGPNGIADSAADVQGNDFTVIRSVTDNIRDPSARKFYEIVPGGLFEDSRSYVDRPHEWNGLTSDGMPAYLLGAEYIKTFNEDRTLTDFQMEIELNGPAYVYVFYDERRQLPEWLMRDFDFTGDYVGLDLNAKRRYVTGLGRGPGRKIDFAHSVWVKVVEDGKVTLGSNNGDADYTGNWTAMYGIAVVPVDTNTLPAGERDFR